MIRVLSFLFFVLGWAGFSFAEYGGTSDQAEQTIKINLVQPIQKNKSKETNSVFVELTAKADEIGLRSAKLSGSIEQKPLADNSTRYIITWRSISLFSGGNLTGNLKSPLTSRFRTKDSRIEPGTILTARGDLESLVSDFLALKKKADKNSGHIGQEEKHIAEAEEKRENSSPTVLNPGSGGSGRTSGPERDSSDDSFADLHTFSFEACQPKVSLDDYAVYKQHRRVEKDKDGNIVSTGPCILTGESVPVVKEYGEPCSGIYDYINKKVYKQYREYAVIDGQVLDITNCTNDFSQFYEIYAKTDNCGIRDDFPAGESILQHEFYYMNGRGEEIQITGCRDSDTSYDHFLTDLTCTPRINQEQNLVFPFKRIAYNLNDGTVQYAGECRPVSGPGLAPQETFCDPKYEHDFNTGQSFYRTRDYYIDASSEKIYLTECSRSTAESFPHKRKTSDCDLVHDDQNLQSIQKTITYIETDDDGDIEIMSCKESGYPVSHVFVGTEPREAEFTDSGIWTVPAAIKNVSVFLVAGGASGSDGYIKKGGDGGAAGEQITQNVTVSPGQEIPVAIGQSDQDSSFGAFLTARTGYGTEGGAGSTYSCSFNDLVLSCTGGFGGNGADGYGTDIKAEDGTGNGYMINRSGKGGTGYGAGGGGRGYQGTGPGAGAPGYCRITWTVNKYRRPDSTYHFCQP